MSDETAHLIEAMREIYPAKHGWICAREVSEYLGEDPTGERTKRRRSDVLFLKLGGGRFPRAILIENKVEPADVEREVPAKSAPFRAVAERSYLVMPHACWRKVPGVTLARFERQGWGCMVVGTGRPVEHTAAQENPDPKPIGSELWAAIVRAVHRDADRGGAPLRRIVEKLPRSRFLLACPGGGHVVMLLDKKAEGSVPCVGCLNGDPPDEEALDYWIGEAPDDALERARDLINRKLAERAA